MKIKKSPSDAQRKFIVRLPHGMYELIDAAAKRHGRSKTAEIVERLRRSFESENELEEAPPKELVRAAMKLAEDELDALRRLHEILEKKK